VVQAGTPLFTVGDPDSLEVSVDVLSSDAVRMSAGTPVEIVRWGGNRTLRGTVRVVEPLGRTEVSALGVEEQRVEVVSDVELPAAVQGRLGTGYRVVARFVLWAGADVLQVPQSALFRHDGGWAVFVVRGGRAERQPVTVGYRSGLRAQITDGLSEGTQVVTHPGEALEDGSRVEAR
jgi:HlyD family secretion protein